MDLNNEITKISYSLGVNIGQSLAEQGLKEVNGEAFAKAISDFFEGNDLEIKSDEAQQNLQAFFGKLQAESAGIQAKAGLEFLEANANKDGIISLPSGLQYEVMTSGDGEKPSAEDKVNTHYHGTLIDGTVFDSSVERGEPISFPLNGVIAGWTEALQLMPVGSKWRLFVPSHLAYGERGQGAIQPHSTLIFEVELLAIEK
ncbi:FKBP-type peptidyl-prolyl cis-trans isomerase [Flavobacteriales bacterium]|jgi:FKBP-type peptidyl-prolyl cis-trans isomerase FklB|nr:FKBP-type peptidyl-prolyl cis-trans isomerase [Flavobacteriales bacterium]MDC1370297.1 FKBP-type peptidyl-prolyl cis-trans isomerase [Flavobacteriales bacterium]|tara:strand:- start:304 stop:906 length:603 start_codon:yes stop_codon:yes gene_type:complete